MAVRSSLFFHTRWYLAIETNSYNLVHSQHNKLQWEYQM